MQICRGFSDVQWKQLRAALESEDAQSEDGKRFWNTAVEVFERRMRERFVNPIDVLEQADSKLDIANSGNDDSFELPPAEASPVVVPGFAIVGLCCLLIDTLQSFRAKRPPQEVPAGPCPFPKDECIRPENPTTGAFLSFLRLPAFGGEFNDEKIAKSFVRGIRNGILHEAETRKWVIWRDEPLEKLVALEGRGYALNRTRFWLALKEEFNSYLTKLREDKDADLRKRFLEKMDDIIKEC